MSYINELVVKKTLIIEKGKPVLMNKVDFIMFPARGMAKFVQKVGEDLGDEYLYQLGFDAGMIVGKEFVEGLGWFGMGLAKKMNILFKMLEVMGFGTLEIKVWDAKNNKLLTCMTNQPVVEHAAKLYGKESKICIFYDAIISAHWHNEMGIEGCHIIETQCLTKGDPFCELSFNYFQDEKTKEQK